METTEKRTRRRTEIPFKKCRRGGRRGLALLLVLAIILSAAPQGFPQAVHAAVQGEKRTLWYQITGKINSSWDGNIVGELTITNIAQTTAGSWQIDLPWAAEITSMWNGTYEKKDGYYIIRPAGCNQSIAPEESTTIGFLAEGDEETLQKIESARYLEESGTQVTTSAERKEDWYHEPQPIPTLPAALTMPVIETPGTLQTTSALPIIPSPTADRMQEKDLVPIPSASRGTEKAATPKSQASDVIGIPEGTEGPAATDSIEAAALPEVTEKPGSTALPETTNVSAVTNIPKTIDLSEAASLSDATDASLESEVSTGDWHIYSDTILTENIVCDNLFLVGGKLRLNGYTLRVRENASILSDGMAVMDREADTLQIGGNLLADSSKASTWNKGTLQLAGDLTQTGGAEEIPFQASSAFQIECNGKSQQTISLPEAEQTNLGMLSLDESAGVETKYKLKCTNITGLSQITNKDTLELEAASLNLSQDEESYSSIHLSGGTCTLNKYRWDIHGNLTVSNGATKNITLPAGSCLSVDGNLSLDEGMLMMRQSVLKTGGNLRFGSDGSIHQYSENYALQIGGDLNVQSQKYAYRATAKGNITVKGDIVQAEEAHVSSLALPSQVTLSLEGDGPQSIRLAHPDTSSLGCLNLTGSAGVEINHKLKCTNITGLSQITNKDTLELEAASLNLSQNEESHCNVILGVGLYSLNGHQWTIRGNLHIKMGQNDRLVLPAGSKLSVKGDITLEQGQLQPLRSGVEADGDITLGAEGRLHSYAEEYHLKTGGSLHIGTHYAYPPGSGTITVGRDIIQEKSAAKDSFTLGYGVKVYLTGKNSQTISLPHTDYIDCLDITRSHGVQFRQDIKGNRLYGIEKIQAPGGYDCYFDEAYAGGDGTLHGDLTCMGKLSTCGYNLTIDGNFEQNGDVYLKYDRIFDSTDNTYSTLEVTGNYTARSGILYVNMGEVYVHGNIKIKKNAALDMIRECRLRTDGNFTMGSGDWEHSHMQGGTLAVKGDILQTPSSSVGSMKMTGTKLVLNGSKKQKVTLQDEIYEINIINMRGSAGVTFASGNLKSSRILGFDKIQNPALTLSGGELFLEQEETYHGDLSLYSGMVNCNGHQLHIKGTLEQYGTAMQLGRGKLLVDGGYQLHSGTLRLLFEQDLLHVGGDFVTTTHFNQRGYLKNGRFELDGNFSQEGGESSFDSTEDFTIAFTGEEIQDVHFDDIQHSGFANIDPQYAGYRTNDTPVIMAGRLSYHIALGLIEGFQKMLGLESFQAVAVAAMAQLGITLVAGAVTLPATVVVIATVVLATISIIGDCFMAAQCLDSIYSASKGSANMYDRARIYARDGIIVLLSMIDGCEELIKSKEAIKGIFNRLSSRKPSDGGDVPPDAGEEDVENIDDLFGNQDLLNFSQIETVEDVVKLLEGKVTEEGLAYILQQKGNYSLNVQQLRIMAEAASNASKKYGVLLTKDEISIAIERVQKAGFDNVDALKEGIDACYEQGGVIKRGIEVLKDRIQKVEYGSTELSKDAIQFRKENRMGKSKNIAVLEYKDSDGRLQRKVFPSGGERHSEQKAIAFIEENGIRAQDVTQLYTEREPCAISVDMPCNHCSGLLKKALPMTRISYSIDYGTTKSEFDTAKDMLNTILKDRLN